MFYINNDKLVFITLLPEIEVIFPPYYIYDCNIIFVSKGNIYDFFFVEFCYI